MRSIIQDGSDEMPPTVFEGATHIILGGLTMDKRTNRLSESELELVIGGASCGVDDGAVRREKKSCSKCGDIGLNYKIIDGRIYCGLCGTDITEKKYQ